MMHVNHHAYYRPPLGFAKPQSLSDWILLFPKGTRHRFVDDHNKGVIFIIHRTETSAALDRNPNRFKIARADRPVIRRVVYTSRFRWTAFDIKRPGIVGAAERQVGRESGRLHTRNIARALEEFHLEGRDPAMRASSKGIVIP